MSEWMMALVGDVIKSKQQKSASGLDIKMLIEETTNKQVSKKARSVSETSEPEGMSSKRRSGSGRQSESSEGGAREAELEAGVATLMEMFPACCRVEAVHCLTIMGGDLERAAQMALTRAETGLRSFIFCSALITNIFVGEDMKLSQAQVLAQLTKPVTVPETEIKRKIMDNYGFVDTDHDIKYHRPIVSKKGVSEQ